MGQLFDSRLRLRHLQCLVAVASHRSVQKAADALAQTPSAVSKSLSELEGMVGARLFARRRTGLQQTPAGETLLGSATRAFGALHEGFLALDQGSSLAKQINIGVLPTAAALLVPLAILGMQAEFPQLVVNVHAGLNSEMLKRLRARELDLVLGRLPDPAEMYGVSFEALYTEPMILAVRPGHPLQGTEPDASQVARYPLVLPLAGTTIRQAAEAFFISSGVAVPRAQINTLTEAVGRELVGRSDAVWFVPLGVVQSELDSGRIVRLHVDTGATRSAVGLSFLADAPGHHLVEMFADRIRSLAASLRESGNT